MPVYLTKQQILAAEDRKFVDVEVPEWGGVVRVGTMTAAQRDQYEVKFAQFRKMDRDGDLKDRPISMRALLVAACLVDAEGKNMFTVEDVELLGQKSGAALNRVFSQALELNVLTKVAAERVEGN